MTDAGFVLAAGGRWLGHTLNASQGLGFHFRGNPEGSSLCSVRGPSSGWDLHSSPALPFASAVILGSHWPFLSLASLVCVRTTHSGAHCHSVGPCSREGTAGGEAPAPPGRLRSRVGPSARNGCMPHLAARGCGMWGSSHQSVSATGATNKDMEGRSPRICAVPATHRSNQRDSGSITNQQVPNPPGPAHQTGWG